MARMTRRVGSPLRVGLFSDTFAPDPNGVATSVLLLQRELSKLGVDAWVVAPSVKGAPLMPRVLRVRSVRNPVIIGSDTRLSFPRSKRLPGRFDVIHAHTPWVIGVWANRVARQSGAAMVATYHTDLEKYAHYFPGGAFLQRHLDLAARASRRFYNPADVLVAPSDATAKLLVSYDVRSPVRVVPTGIDADLLALGPSRVDAWPVGSRRLLTVARLGPEKRLDVVLRTLARVREGEPLAHLVIVGEGQAEGDLRDLAAQLGVQDAVTFVGAVPYAQVGGYYRAAETFVFASDTETQGLVLAEAQMMGLPVVAVGAGGTLLAVRDGEGGFLVAPGDVDALAARTLAVLHDEDLACSLSVGARRAAEAFSAGTSARLMLEAYEEAISLANARMARLARAIRVR